MPEQNTGNDQCNTYVGAWKSAGWLFVTTYDPVHCPAKKVQGDLFGCGVCNMVLRPYHRENSKNDVIQVKRKNNSKDAFLRKAGFACKQHNAGQAYDNVIGEVAHVHHLVKPLAVKMPCKLNAWLAVPKALFCKHKIAVEIIGKDKVLHTAGFGIKKAEKEQGI